MATFGWRDWCAEKLPLQAALSPKPVACELCGVPAYLDIGWPADLRRARPFARAADTEVLLNPLRRHGKNLNSDLWRQMQLWKATANQAHPFSKFATGNYDTLMTRPKVGVPLIALANSPGLTKKGNRRYPLGISPTSHQARFQVSRATQGERQGAR